ncbi:MAG: hypothetical protein AAF348_19480 [Bacteroidota bacterium]
MKSTRIIWLILFFINISCGQDKPTTINVDKISVLSINYETKLSEILEILGEPLSQKRYEDIDGSVTDEPDIYNYLNYKGIEIQFVKYGYSDVTSIESIEIKSNQYPVLVDQKTLRVGEDYEKIKSILPYEYNKFLERHDEINPDKKYQIIGGNLTKGKLEPSNIVFDFKNGKIIQISIGFPL